MNLNEQKKTALITYLILIAAIVLLLFAYIAIAIIIGNSFDESTPEEMEAEIAAEREFFPKLDEMYSAGDYKGLVGLIYSSEAEKINVRNYGHYDLAEFYRDYLKIKDYYIPMLDRGSISGIDAREMTSIV